MQNFGDHRIAAIAAVAVEAQLREFQSRDPRAQRILKASEGGNLLGSDWGRFGGSFKGEAVISQLEESKSCKITAVPLYAEMRLVRGLRSEGVG